jgi:uncharacterized protein (DUF302 family)
MEELEELSLRLEMIEMQLEYAEDCVNKLEQKIENAIRNIEKDFGYGIDY